VALLIALRVGAAFGTPLPPLAPGSGGETATRGGGSLSGKVVNVATGRPVSRSTVTLRGAKVRGSPSTETNAQGQYAFEGLPADQYMVEAYKDGFVRGYFADARTKTAGLVYVEEGGRRDGVDVALRRGGVIAGLVVDEDGEPALGATVRAIRRRYTTAGIRLEIAATFQADDLGSFRLFGLAPGSYFVTAVPRVSPSVLPPASRQSATPPVVPSVASTFYPSAASLGDASPVAVDAGAETPGVLISLLSLRVACISGRIAQRQAAQISTSSVALIESVAGGGGRLVAETIAETSSGLFRFELVPPGRYTLVAAGHSERGEPVHGTASVAVAGEDAEVAIMLGPPGTVDGEVTTDPGTAERLESMQVTLLPMSVIPRTVRAPTVTLNRDGSFLCSAVPPGDYVIRVSGNPRWTLVSARLGVADVADEPFTVESGERVSGLTVQLSTQPTDLAGIVADSGVGIAQVPVAVFTANPNEWQPHSRRVEILRTTQGGRFRTRGLPPGDYRVAALLGLEAGDVADPEVLRRIADRATRVVLRAGQPTTIEIRPLIWQVP
jgi:hypothetical protein